MNLAKVSSARQITVPMDIYKFLGLRPGDKLLFTEKKNGEVSIRNASTTAIFNAQKSFRGIAEKNGLENDESIMQMVREVRYGEGEK
ncbi:AbrB/MazE/SpoVT family DNA-binding domain-containing protein [Candidatus Saccharibacteria bacterium]|nr:AbrB/MazE/SpoVT family DNA-binding domain-containing protein [Candidatus Saccharibacteria bacterium]